MRQVKTQILKILEMQATFIMGVVSSPSSNTVSYVT